MSASQQAVLGLGANLGDPIQQILDARLALTSLPHVISWQCSSMYASSPVGYLEQPDFINCVLLLQTTHQVESLFEQMQEIELNLGRVRNKLEQNAPRMIDIDLLMFAEQRVDTSKLTIPHPRMTQRRFVIEPLSELGIYITPHSDVDFANQSLIRLAI